MKNEYLRRLILVLMIIFVTVFIDQVSKFLISKNMELYSLKSIIPGVFNFRYITNYGFLLGIGSNLNDGKTFNGVVIITIIALLVLLGYFIYIFFQKSTSNFLLITFSILIGGAWGNFLDRLIKGKVVDFLEFVLPFHRIGKIYIGSTPIFNMADFFVTVGIILLLIYYFIIEPKEHLKLKSAELNNQVKETSDENVDLHDNLIKESNTENIESENSQKEESPYFSENNNDKDI